MKTCPKCGAQIADEASFCTSCGYNLNEAGAAPTTPQPQYQQPQFQQPQFQQPVYQQPMPSYGECTPVNPCDKVLGIVAVMYSFVGVIIAYFGGDVNGQRSEYLRFYANEGLVLAIFSLFGAIPFIGWFLWSPFMLICQIIAIVNACKGVAKPVLFFGTIRIIH